MNGGHGTNFDAEFLVQEVSHWCQAVGCARTSRNNLVVCIQSVIVDVVNDGLHLAGWGRNQNTLCACVQMSL